MTTSPFNPDANDPIAPDAPGAPGAPGGTERAADARAIERLIEAGWDPAKITDAADRTRAQRIAAFFRSLESRTADDAASTPQAQQRTRQSLIDLTILRAMRSSRVANDDFSDQLQLAPMDEEAADAWMRADYDAARVPSDLRSRAEQHQRLATLLGAGLTGEGATPGAKSRRDLIDATMRAVVNSARTNADPLSIESARTASRNGWGGAIRNFRGFRVADLATAAAAVLVLGSVLWPMLAAVRGNSIRTACFGNLGQVAGGLTSYANTFRDSLPVATASLGGGRWWDVGAGSSNSANLFTLYKTGFVAPDVLACPGNPNACSNLTKSSGDWQKIEDISYSLQILFGPYQPRWNHEARTPVMADRSPVVLASIKGVAVSPTANSPNHSGYGQHLLFNDGSAEWAESPVLKNGDNIWLPRPVEDLIKVLRGQADPDSLKPLQGSELPAENDAFMGP